MGGSLGGGKSDSSNDSLNAGYNTNSSIGGGVNISKGTNSAVNQNQSQSTGTSQQDIWAGQSPYLTGGYQAAANLGLSQIPQYNQAAQEGQQWNKDVMGVMTPVMQQQAAGGIYAKGGAGENFRGEAGKLYNTGLGQSQWGGASNFGEVNPYVDAQKQAIAADAGVAGNQMMNSMDARAAGSGMSGGSRHGTAIAQGMGDINRNMQNAQANVGFQANEAAQNRRMDSEEAERERRMAAGEAQKGRQIEGAQFYENSLNNQEATTNMMVGNTGNIMDLGQKQYGNLNNQFGGIQNYMGAIGGPTALTQQQNQATGSGSGSSQGQTDSLGYNYNQSQGYGENAGMGEGSSNSWNFNVAGGM